MTTTPKTDALREMLKQPCSCGNDGNLNKDFHDEFCPWANGEALAVREFEKLERELNEAKVGFDINFTQAIQALKERDKWRECAQRLADVLNNHWNGGLEHQQALARFDELEKGSKPTTTAEWMKELRDGDELEKGGQ